MFPSDFSAPFLMTADEYDRLGPVVVEQPDRGALPLIVSSPHSGRFYDPEFVASSRLPLSRLRSGEDAFIDLLVREAALSCGATFVRALFPRVLCDVNRDALDVDPSLVEGNGGRLFRPGERGKAGLGSVPSVASGGALIYAHKLSLTEISDRLNGLWRPYHRALHDQVQAFREAFGICVLLDVHSMAPGLCAGQGAYIIGDRYGSSASLRFSAAVSEALKESGKDVVRNRPFAGGFITAHYGKPRHGVHAVQIEIRQDLYMTSPEKGPHAGFRTVQKQLRDVIAAVSGILADDIATSGFRRAAE
ncbi:MAG: N-formylglutamate amidohydrolase [Acetobacter sp.]|jgi:N-formylglutamate amidohydrolase